MALMHCTRPVMWKSNPHEDCPLDIASKHNVGRRDSHDARGEQKYKLNMLLIRMLQCSTA